MAFQIRCPNEHVLLIDDQHFGKQIRCPTCQAVMFIAAPVVPPSSAHVSPQPVAAPPTFKLKEEAPLADVAPLRKPTDTSNAQRMRITRHGMACHYARVLLVLISILSVIIWIVLVTIVDQARVQSPFLTAAMAGLIVVTAGVGVLCLTLAPILAAIGSLLCLWVPHKTGARLLIVLSFSLDCIGFFAWIGGLGFALAVAGLRTEGWGAVGLLPFAGLLVWALLAFAAWVFFMLFVRGMFVFFGDSFAANETYALLIQSAVLSVVTPIWCVVVLYVGAYVAENIDRTGSQIVMGALFLLAILVWVWVLLRILAMIKGIRGRLERWL